MHDGVALIVLSIWYINVRIYHGQISIMKNVLCYEKSYTINTLEMNSFINDFYVIKIIYS